MGTNPEATEEIRDLHSTFKEGYAKRDLAALDGFMNLFAAQMMIFISKTPNP